MEMKANRYWCKDCISTFDNLDSAIRHAVGDHKRTEQDLKRPLSDFLEVKD